MTTPSKSLDRGIVPRSLLSRRNWLGRMARLVRYRLIIPVKRGIHRPEHTARGVMIGLMWGFTPIIGQMYGVIFTWFIARRIFAWNFCLINGMAWTWVTNIFTTAPSFYLFYRTGKFFMGHSFLGNSGDYQSFTDKLLASAPPEASLWEVILGWGEVIISDWGPAMAIGCIPWSILAGWIGYRLSLRFAEKIQFRRRRRLQERLAAAGALVRQG